MTESLNKETTYLVGDFIIKVMSDNQLRITTDKGTVVVRPKSDNAVLVESWSNKVNQSNNGR